jgi:hypothetical protein
MGFKIILKGDLKYYMEKYIYIYIIFNSCENFRRKKEKRNMRNFESHLRRKKKKFA